MRTKYSSQVYRADGAGKFVEVLNSAFPIDKVQLNAIEYDKNTNKQTRNLPIYVDVNKMLVLAEDVLNGNFKKKVDEAKVTKTFEGKPLNAYTCFFTDMGGIDETKVSKRFAELKAMYPFLTEGMAISRQLKIQAAARDGLDWIIRVEYGPGKSDSKGLIVPNGNAPIYVNVAVNDETFKEMMMALKMHYNAYLFQHYNRFGKELFPTDSVNVFKPDKN